MKNITLATIFLALGLIFSGCAVKPAADSLVANTEFVLSKSIYKSIDGGKTWEAKTKGDGKANAKSIEVLNFVVNPFDSTNVYVGLKKGGILESTDGGEVWEFLNNYTSEKVYGLALSPVDGRTLTAAGVWSGRGKVFQTADKGDNWKEIYTSPSEGSLIIALAMDKNNSNVLYASTSDNEVLKSSDGGISWKNIYLADTPILKIAIDSANANLIYFVTNSGLVMCSRDAGNTFEELSEKLNRDLSGSDRGAFTIVEVDPSVSGRVYLAGEGGLAVSNNGGENWKKIYTLNDPRNFPIRALAVNPKNSQEIIYSVAQTVYRSTDGGATWVTSQFDNGMQANVLKYDPLDPNNVYLGFTK